jgi:UDP-N-acetylmuramate--alanine ligase
LSLPDLKTSHFYYAGIAGAGMSALAQFQALKGGRVSGSDRGLVPGSDNPWFNWFGQLGITCFPQDGSGLDRTVDAVVVSTAVESDNADLRRAKELGIPVFHRSRVLAGWVNASRCVAVAGTSGKSTVAAMVFEVLRHAGFSPSIITGGNLVSLREEGYAGNAFAGESDILVSEADESDGTLSEYSPEVGIILNIEKDHKEVSELLELFRKFHGQSKYRVVNGAAPLLAGLAGSSVTFGGAGNFRADRVRLLPDRSLFMVNGVDFELPMPGVYNVENALAAIAACFCLNVNVRDMAQALKEFKGVARRFQVLGKTDRIEVVDDYAHNPVKVEAAMAAAHLRAKRVLAVFQPHGYGPTRFLKGEFIAALERALTDDDVLFMPEIYYAGGTVTRDISSADIIDALKAKGKNAFFFADREAIPVALKTMARPGNLVLLMGARDPSLTEFGKRILSVI